MRFGSGLFIGAAFVVALAATAPVLAAGRAGAERETTYGSFAECVNAKALSVAECRRAFANARAEFLEKAPRFPDRSQCERRFGACSVALAIAPGAGRRRGAPAFDYMPQFRAVKVSIHSAAEREVTPVLAGVPATAFQPRSLALDDDTVSPARLAGSRVPGGRAQRRGARPVRSAPPALGTPAAAPAGADEDAAAPSDPTITPMDSYPVSGRRWHEMQDRARRLGAKPRR